MYHMLTVPFSQICYQDAKVEPEIGGLPPPNLSAIDTACDIVLAGWRSMDLLPNTAQRSGAHLEEMIMQMPNPLLFILANPETQALSFLAGQVKDVLRAPQCQSRLASRSPM